MRRLFVLAVFASLLGGCALFQSILRSFRQPTLTFKTAALSDASLGGITVDLIYTLHNPNRFGLSIAEVDYAFFVEGKQVVSGRPPRGLTIPSAGQTDVHLPANVRFANLGAVVQTFLNKEVASYRAQGTLGIQTPIGIIRIPLSKEGQFEVPKVPQVSFAQPRISQITLSSATVEFPVNVQNRNSFPLPIRGLAGNLSIGGANVGTLSTGDLGPLTARGQKQIRLPLTIHFLQAAAAANAVRRGNGQVQFTGQIQSGDVGVPLSFGQVLQFAR